MPNSKLKCRGCKDRFPREEGITLNGGFFHSILCATEYAQRKGKENREKAKRKEIKIRKAKLKTAGDWKREVQSAFNKYIRLRDKGEPCISCGKPDNGMHQRHASHFRSVGACSSLRFNELNVWASCSTCNNHLSGNLINYRIALVNKLGEEKVLWLESQPKHKRYGIDELKEMRDYYRKLCREKEKENEAREGFL